MTTTSNKNDKSLDLVSHIVRFRSGEKYNLSYISIIVLIIAALFFIEDIYIDIVVEGKGFTHVILESGVFIGICLALALQVRRAIKLTSTVSNIQDEVTRLKRHLNELILEEFDRWKLTKTEKDIAIMLIKGYSMQEIAELRGVKEKSVRQQATGIYSKANLSNRYELTSHFIEDLLAVPTN
jgi:DNA-binding CsgD family transcriptional regulator